MPAEVTTTSGIPIFFPDRKKKRKKLKRGKTMNEVELALYFVENDLEPEEALDLVIEQDMDKAAKKMAKKAAPDDPEKQKELEAKFKKQMKKEQAPPFKKKKKNGDDEYEGRGRRKK